MKLYLGMKPGVVEDHMGTVLFSSIYEDEARMWLCNGEFRAMFVVDAKQCVLNSVGELIEES